MTDEVESLSRLARAVRERRRRLGITQEQVARHGGPSARTVRSIENEATPSPGAGTLKALDDGLFWDRGTASSLVAGTLGFAQAVEARQVAVRLQPEELELSRAIQNVAAAAKGVPYTSELATWEWSKFPSSPAPEPEGRAAGFAAYRASGPLARALAELQAIEDPTAAEIEATGAVWKALSGVMYERLGGVDEA